MAGEAWDTFIPWMTISGLRVSSQTAKMHFGHTSSQTSGFYVTFNINAPQIPTLILCLLLTLGSSKVLVFGCWAWLPLGAADAIVCPCESVRPLSEGFWARSFYTKPGDLTFGEALKRQHNYRISANRRRGVYLFRWSVWCGDYSRAASIRGRRLFEGGVYSRVASILLGNMTRAAYPGSAHSTQPKFGRWLM